MREGAGRVAAAILAVVLGVVTFVALTVAECHDGGGWCGGDRTSTNAMLYVVSGVVGGAAAVAAAVAFGAGRGARAVAFGLGVAVVALVALTSELGS
ncbi:MAG TPA: hypothetical protein VGX28_07540 [Frankiaceae bacterium]|nr:hypothetical protein [Frankiaceae bacterium]